MRYLLVLVLLWGSLTISGTTYYIDPSGNNSNNGSSGSPWKTLAYACSKATVAGDIIHVNAGTYSETSQSSLAVGVSIEGAGVTSVIRSTVGGTDFTILLNSASQGTNGNQHIRNIKMDGASLAAYGAIRVVNRSNVEINNCTFVDFNYYCTSFNGGEPPSTYSTGNKFHDNSVTNCSKMILTDEGKGAITINGQQTMSIYNNYLDQTSRPAGANGYLIKGVTGYNKDVKIYNNTINKAPYSGISGDWDFAIELWECRGGIEIYGNIITNGSIDVSGSSTVNAIATQKGSYAYSIWIHDNTIARTALASSDGVRGILIEQSAEYVIIERNHIKNVDTGIYFPLIYQGATLDNVRISYNLIEVGNQVGSSGYGYGVFFQDQTGFTVQDINIWNNTVVGLTGGKVNDFGIGIPASTTSRRISIRNNIVKGFSTAAVMVGRNAIGTASIVSIENNNFYGNGNSNTPYYGSRTPTSLTVQNNLTSDPLFVSSGTFSLQSGSPAIGKGLAIAGLTSDCAGSAVKNPPSMGAYESGSGATPVVVVPIYQTATIENATPSLLTMTYNMSLAGIVPAASSFTAMVNSVKRTINSVAISGSLVQLTLASQVLYGDIVTIAYTVPSGNQLQTTSGGLAAALTTQTASNKVSGVNPVYASSSIENISPAVLAMTYSTTLANIVPASSSFSVLVNSLTRTVSSVSITGNKVQLTLASKIVSGDIVKVSYTKPAGSPLQTASGITAGSISNQPVINNCINAAPTSVVTSPVSGSTFSAQSNISITANALDADGSISLVEFYNGSTKLGSASVAPYTFTWNNVTSGNYLLTAIATDNLSARTTSSVISISVTTRNTPNRKPFVRISNPHKGTTYEKLSTISIDAIASDPDGTISKVELFNGTSRLVEMTSAPYTFTWKDVIAGTYKITAIATDNLNDTTVSAPVEFIVGTTVKYDANSDIVKLYPNPNNGHFSIEFVNPIQSERSEIVITDLAGKQVFNGPLLKEETLKQFDLSDSRSGVYVMMIKDKDIYVTKKFIKN